jgi:hypothetical protein
MFFFLMLYPFGTKVYIHDFQEQLKREAIDESIHQQQTTHAILLHCAHHQLNRQHE